MVAPQLLLLPLLAAAALLPNALAASELPWMANDTAASRSVSRGLRECFSGPARKHHFVSLQPRPPRRVSRPHPVRTGF